MIDNLERAIDNYINDPKNQIINFDLGFCYESKGQTAAAVSFYIRTSEFGTDDVLTYEALLRAALCLERQGSRVFTVKGMLLRAVSLLPLRPEAYFLLARIYERSKDWQEAYTWCVMGAILPVSGKNLKTDVEYPGPYGFTFEKAVVAWWIGLHEESQYLFKQLEKNTRMLDIHKQAVKKNLDFLGKSAWRDPIEYNESYYDKLRVKFPGAEAIDKNYSQCYQDMFVLTMLKGKHDGFFLEIGCGDPFYGSNTYLLEKEFGWKGISIDIDPASTSKFPGNRKCQVLTEDATKLDYKEFLLLSTIDYLQIDCDPATVSLAVLKKIPLNLYKFAVITFEHDHYNDESGIVRNQSRDYLESFGYELVVGNISPDRYNPFEDWWVHPDLVDRTLITMMSNNSGQKKADDYMLLK
jgi:tetratricopeptide (TPR) repeat protein